MASKTLTDKRYIGKVCGKHPEWEGLRKKGNHECVQCTAERVKAFRKANPDKDAAIAKAWYETNKQSHAAVQKEWREANPDKVNAKAAKYRAAKMDRTPAWADFEKIAEFYRLAQELGLVVDHIVPLQGELVSGLHVHINLQLLTPSENSAKCNKFHG